MAVRDLKRYDRLSFDDSCSTEQQVPLLPALHDTRNKDLDRARMGGMSLTVLGIQFSRLSVDHPYAGQDEADPDQFNQSDGFSQNQG